MMNLLRQRYRAWLVPYVEGTLDARRQAKLEAWLAHDPVLAAEAEAERRVTARLREAAQAMGNTGKPESLWPSILARLEPRRSPVRPLLLVGGLSAAAATLVGAALWGPLKPAPPLPLPQPMVAKNDPGVIIVVPPSVHKGRHSIHSAHRGSGGSKRLAIYHAVPTPEPRTRRDETQPQNLLAVNPAETSDGNDPDSASSAPKFVPSNHNFRLAGNEHSTQSDPATDAPPANSGAATGSTDTLLGGSDTADTPSRPAENAAPDTPPAVAATPADSAGTKPAGTPHRRKRHRRHNHPTHAPTQSASEHGEKVPDGTDNAPVVHDTPPASPKVGVKPVE